MLVGAKWGKELTHPSRAPPGPHSVRASQEVVVCTRSSASPPPNTVLAALPRTRLCTGSWRLADPEYGPGLTVPPATPHTCGARPIRQGMLPSAEYGLARTREGWNTPLSPSRVSQGGHYSNNSWGDPFAAGFGPFEHGHSGNGKHRRNFRR